MSGSYSVQPPHRRLLDLAQTCEHRVQDHVCRRASSTASDRGRGVLAVRLRVWSPSRPPPTDVKFNSPPPLFLTGASSGSLHRISVSSIPSRHPPYLHRVDTTGWADQSKRNARHLAYSSPSLHPFTPGSSLQGRHSRHQDCHPLLTIAPGRDARQENPRLGDRLRPEILAGT